MAKRTPPKRAKFGRSVKPLKEGKGKEKEKEEEELELSLEDSDSEDMLEFGSTDEDQDLHFSDMSEEEDSGLDEEKGSASASETSDFSELEEFDDDEDDELLDDEDATDEAMSIAYSSSEEEDHGLDRVNRLVTQAQLEAWMTSLNATSSPKTYSRILTLFSSWAFGMNEDLLVELEHEDTNASKFHDFIFGPFVTGLTTLLQDGAEGRDTSSLENHKEQRLRSLQAGKAWPSLKKSLKTFLTAFASFLGLNHSTSGRAGVTDRLEYLLKFGVTAFLPYFAMFPRLLKLLVKTLLGLWALPTAALGTTTMLLPKNTNEERDKGKGKGKAKGKHPRSFDPIDQDLTTDTEEDNVEDIEARDKKVRMLAFIVVKRISERSSKTAMLVMKTSYGVLHASTLMSRESTREQLAPFLIATLVQLWLPEEPLGLPKGSCKDKPVDYEGLLVQQRRLEARQRIAYQVGFPRLRQLAVLLAQLQRNPSPENRGKVISWKWLFECQLWAALLARAESLHHDALRVHKRSIQSATAARPSLQSQPQPQPSPPDLGLCLLCYPFFSLLLAVLQWTNNKAGLVPFQLHVLHCMDTLLTPRPLFPLRYNLLQSELMSRVGVVDLAISAQVLAILNLVHDRLRSAPKATRLPHGLSNCLIVADEYVELRLFSDAVIKACLGLLRSDILRVADCLAFPELMESLTWKLKALQKRTRNVNLSVQLTGLLKSIKDHATWLQQWRRRASSPSILSIASASYTNPQPLCGQRLVTAAGFSLQKAPIFTALAKGPNN